jgi:hypothetical protein
MGMRTSLELLDLPYTFERTALLPADKFASLARGRGVQVDGWHLEDSIASVCSSRSLASSGRRSTSVATEPTATALAPSPAGTRLSARGFSRGVPKACCSIRRTSAFGHGAHWRAR